jgi:P-type Cu+ transporter
MEPFKGARRFSYLETKATPWPAVTDGRAGLNTGRGAVGHRLAKDPVCGMFVQEGPGALKAELRGATYYFCSRACRMEFVAPERELKRIRLLVALGAGLTVPILALTYLPLMSSDASNYALLALAFPVQFVVGSRFYAGAYHALRSGASNMDLLVAVGTSSAFGYSAVAAVFPSVFGVKGVYFDAAAVIITLVLAGKLLEHMTKERASDSLRKLLELRPRVAHLLRSGSFVEVPVEDLAVGDEVEVKPGERVPTDGLVVDGTSTADESLMTGESRPVEKGPGSQVIGGSINAGGRILVKATAVGRDTVLGQMTKLVEEARAGKAPIQRLADRVARYFVPAILAVAVVAALGWRASGVPVATSMLVFVSVVIIACPCALGIATPAALLVGTANAAKRGILVKGGEAVEAAAHVDTVLLDKTGTITEGRQSVVAVMADDKDRVLAAAAALERSSEHSLAAAIVREAASRGLGSTEPEGFAAAAGAGVSGKVGGVEVKVGRRDFVGLDGPWEGDSEVSRLRDEGNTVVFVRAGGDFGAIAIGDTVKRDAEGAIRQMTAMGLSVVMITGDDPATARAVAKRVGIEEVRAGLLPQAKETEVERLQGEGRVVAMVGDGVNDAPALAKADVGIAIGSGTDVAKETGGIVLVKDTLADAVAALQIGRATMRKIRQNLIWAFGYNLVLVPVAAGALIPFYGVGVYSFLPFLAGAAMALSSVSVVSNSLLLARYEPPGVAPPV